MGAGFSYTSVGRPVLSTLVEREREIA